MLIQKFLQYLKAIMTRIPLSEIHVHSSFDPAGYVFRWRGGVYRAVFPASEKHMTSLLDSGLIEELTAKGLFPATKRTELQTHDCNLVLQHAKIECSILPSEWSFRMLKDAAICTLEVNIVARKYGYQTLDAHGFNILFDGGLPVFIDLGSFIRIERELSKKEPGWRPLGEFMRSFYAPLKIWQKGGYYLARKALLGDQIPMADAWRITNILSRFVPKQKLKQFERLYYGYKGLNTVSESEFQRFLSVSPTRKKIGGYITNLSKRNLLPLTSVDLIKLKRKVQNLESPKIGSAWANYHSESALDSRFIAILDTIKKYQPNSVLDMAGNAGFVTKAIVENTNVKRAVCADYDHNAIDALYKSIRCEKGAITPVLLNFSMSISDTKFGKPEDRLKSEMVIALAITHHLILAQKLTLDFILARLGDFSSKYVLVEFMPLGLYSSEFDTVPSVPDWYTRDWFRDGVRKRFELLGEQELSTNRILFVASKKS